MHLISPLIPVPHDNWNYKPCKALVKSPPTDVDVCRKLVPLFCPGSITAFCRNHDDTASERLTADDRSPKALGAMGASDKHTVSSSAYW